MRKLHSTVKSLEVPEGVVRVVFATVALGMGINLQDVNTILHYGAPLCIEDYFQESGRGGRSGETSLFTIFTIHLFSLKRGEPGG